jgi:hypothetical protein
MIYPTLLFWALVPFCVMAPAGAVLVILLASIPFAGFAVIPINLVGGLAILPQSIFATMLVLKVVASRLTPLSSSLVTALQLRNLGFLALFLLVGTVATLIMPRLFLGDIVIHPLREAWKFDTLKPSLGNLTQLCYVALSVMTAFAVTLLADEPRFIKTLLTGMLAGGVVCIITGLVDIGASSAGLQDLLKPFRNAEYVFITSAGTAEGARRVVGFTPEASAYGPICVQFATALALLRTLRTRRVLITVVLFGLVVMAYLSTSSTAYVGLAVLALAYGTNLIRRALFSPAPGQIGLMWDFLAGFVLAVALLLILIARADLLDPLFSVVQEMILNKPLTSSYYERTDWTNTAWNTVASTWGLGIGFGSTRTSNWFAAIVSQTGLLGAALMGIFLILIFFRRPTWPTSLSAELLPILRLSLLPALAMAGINTAGPDFGIWIGVVFGAIGGLLAFRIRPYTAGYIARNGPIPESVGSARSTGTRAPAWRLRTSSRRSRRHQPPFSEEMTG